MLLVLAQGATRISRTTIAQYYTSCIICGDWEVRYVHAKRLRLQVEVRGQVRLGRFEFLQQCSPRTSMCSTTRRCPRDILSHNSGYIYNVFLVWSGLRMTEQIVSLFLALDHRMLPRCERIPVGTEKTGGTLGGAAGTSERPFITTCRIVQPVPVLSPPCISRHHYPSSQILPQCPACPHCSALGSSSTSHPSP